MILTDILIIGGGPAGISAALESRRRGLDHRLVTNELPGGLVGAAEWITNLADYLEGISGSEYREILSDRVKESGIEITWGHIDTIERSKCGFLSRYPGGKIFSHSVILATGTYPLDFYIPGLGLISPGRNFHRDIRTMPDRLTGSVVCIIGGGEAAVDSSLSALRRGAEVRIFCKNRKLKISEKLRSRFEQKRIPVHFDTGIRGIIEEAGVSKLSLHSCGSEIRQDFDHVLAAIGRSPRNELWHRMSGKPHAPEIQTSVPGFFLAGDLIRGQNRFIPNALSDGQMAAGHAQSYLDSNHSRIINQKTD